MFLRSEKHVDQVLQDDAATTKTAGGEDDQDEEERKVPVFDPWWGEVTTSIHTGLVTLVILRLYSL